MASTSEASWEQNEVNWWANWAAIKWFTRDAYLISSDNFHEYFFNRGGFITAGRDAYKSVPAMEVEFRRHDLVPHIFIQDVERKPFLMRFLSGRGYRIADQMSVMEAGDGPFPSNHRVKVIRAHSNLMEEWARVYLDAFYGERTLLPQVMPIIESTITLPETTFLLATVDGVAAGELAMFRRSSVFGVYCVGTHPAFRDMRVASTMLKTAHRIAREEAGRLILQTILSDSAESFYLKLGFKRAYLKELFVKFAHP